MWEVALQSRVLRVQVIARIASLLVPFVQLFLFELNSAIHLSPFCLLFEMTGSETYEIKQCKRIL